MRGKSVLMTRSRPTPLDALITSYLYAIYNLPNSADLRKNLELHPVLGCYVDRVLDYAEEQMDTIST